MQVRRIVTGFDAEGRGCVVSDGPAPRSHDFEHIPGFSNTLVWMTDDSAPTGTPSDLTLTTPSVIPGPSASGLTVVKFPPAASFESADPAASAAEQEQALPGLAAAFDADRPGFHTTATVDYVIVLEGELHLKLDRGPEIAVRPGDVVIQNGTAHAWTNRTSEPAVIAAVSIGTKPGRPSSTA
ncbi:cupin domain-containing protein [Cryptosporangium sp. NPDC051539]|uniref:cupin domain-containing protein n=1 Tax=Cryptosporangium sp. NPDC051539 TaxID=3363962 RepID=UPI003799BA5B